MEEKRKITSGNKIPGCERLTRPEEIQGLSKYLGAIRDTQEQWISENMADSPLERPEDAKFKTIELPDKRIKLDGTKEIVLPDRKEGLEIKDDKELPKGKEKLYVQDPSLRTGRIDLNDIKNVQKLPEDVIKIQTKDLNSLPEEVDRLKNVEDPGLRTGKERLVVEEVEEIPNSMIKLDVNDLPELPKDREKIYPSNQDVSLPKSKSTLNNISDPELPSGTIELQDLRKIHLPDKKLDISVEDPTELPNTTINISPEDPDSLRQHIEDLFVQEPDSLRQKRLGLNITEPDQLPDTTINISPKDPDSLPDDRLKIHPEGPKELPDDRLDIHPEDPELPNSRIDIQPEEVELPNSRLDIQPEEIEELPSDRLNIDVPNVKRIEEVLDSMSADELYEDVMTLLVAGRSGAESTGQGNSELAGIISAYLGDTKLSESRAQEVSRKIIETLDKQRKLIDFAGYVGREQLDREEALGSRITEVGTLEVPEKDTIRSEYLEKEYRQNYGERNRIPGIKYQVPDGDDPTKDPSNFLNPAVYDQDRYLRRLAELAADKGTDVINGLLGGANPNLDSDKISSATRQYILKNTLMALVLARNKLERATGTDRSRLPGGGAILEGIQSLVQGGATGLFGGGIESTIRAGFNSIPKFIDRLAKGVDTTVPQNRPNGRKNILTGRLERIETKKLKRLNSESIINATNRQQRLMKKQGILLDSLNKTVDNISGALRDSKESVTLPGGLVVRNTIANQIPGLTKAKDIIEGKIKDLDSTYKTIKRGSVVFNAYDYFAGEGIELTLADLCPETNIDSINTLEEFKKALIDSPYITTPKKLMNREDGNLTLDTNAYWEIVIEPYVDKEQNGGWSYLPSIAEINRENSIEHNHCTRYSKWIPINGFELQKSKLVSKSLGLFDGEINYPVSVEYTNELRISVVDDQYKSWRRYFQRCADVSTYFSEAHDYSFYQEGETKYETVPTAIDKSMICIAYYKNVTFRIKVYCMTPQYSTIKKFDLLCVMKDFSEEYAGEIEGGGQDLSISFSIVGENPGGNNTVDTSKLGIIKPIIKPKSNTKEAVTIVGLPKEIDDASSSIFTKVAEKSHGLVEIKNK